MHMFTRLDEQGQRIGEHLEVASQPFHPEDNPHIGSSLAWTGSEYGMAWTGDFYYTYFCRISMAGRISGQRLISNWAMPLVLIWTGSELGLHQQEQSYDLYFHRLNHEGIRQGEARRLTCRRAQYPAWAWSGTAYGMIWSDNINGFSRIQFTTYAP